MMTKIKSIPISQTPYTIEIYRNGSGWHLNGPTGPISPIDAGFGGTKINYLSTLAKRVVQEWDTIPDDYVIDGIESW